MRETTALGYCRFGMGRRGTLPKSRNDFPGPAVTGCAQIYVNYTPLASHNRLHRRVTMGEEFGFQIFRGDVRAYAPRRWHTQVQAFLKGDSDVLKG